VAALRAQGYEEEQLPAPSTMATVLNRLGFRLRKVLKAKPQKKIAQTDAIFDNIKKKTPTRRPPQPSNA
jgi:Rhodopirellula transposase DDE domain